MSAISETLKQARMTYGATNTRQVEPERNVIHENQTPYPAGLPGTRGRQGPTLYRRVFLADGI